MSPGGLNRTTRRLGIPAPDSFRMTRPATVFWSVGDGAGAGTKILHLRGYCGNAGNLLGPIGGMRCERVHMREPEPAIIFIGRAETKPRQLGRCKVFATFSLAVCSSSRTPMSFTI